MRERGVLVSLVISSSLLPVALGVAVNVATGGTLPGPLSPLTALAWPVVGVLTITTAALAVVQSRPVPREPGTRPAPADLPLPAAGLAGRDDELSRLRVLVAGGVRAIAITGQAGVGKSALALRLAADVGGRFPDGHLFTDFGAGRTTADLLAWFLTGLGEPVNAALTEDQLLRQYRAALAGRRVLVLLDDAPGTEAVRPLLPTAPECLAIVASRRPLAGLDEAVHFPVPALTAGAAVNLLAAIVGAERVSRDPAGAEALVQACGSLPLAVRIAGARLAHRPGWSITHLAERLADERSRLDELRAGDLAVRSSFQETYDDLPEADRQAFRRLGIVPAATTGSPGRSFGVATAAAALGAPGRDAEAALERLVDSGLLESSGPGRYRMHDLLRLFATECMTAGERADTLDRLIDHYVTLVDDDELAGERDALLALLDRAVDDGRRESAWRLWKATRRSATLHADYRFRVAAAGRAVRAADDPRRHTDALWELGRATDLVGGAVQAHAMLSEALDRWAGEDADRYLLLCHLASASDHLGRLDEAAEHASAARAGFAGLGDVEGEAHALTKLGSIALRTGRAPEAVSLAEQAVALRRPRRDEPDSELAWSLLELGTALLDTGSPEAAGAAFEEALAHQRAHRNTRGEGRTLRALGWLADVNGRPADALAHYEEAVRVLATMGPTVDYGLAHESVGDSRLTLGDPEGAEDAYRKAVDIFVTVANPVRLGIGLLKQAAAQVELGRLRAAGEAEQRAAGILAGVDIAEVRAARDRLAAARRSRPASA
ncbi:ATP-binding protein [Actinoplanes aureus]|uniref:Tetratricopeptide repeat protein n=1 Tax=Actinoplanes aureus TaxID=2792083 RepID=A0A931FZ98_9ACTN|nr:tetratricopeptide repeat protein [Actinoplanes aureus]MBG0564522.1 tetratricopeptide repeat protein [Actinoplanes aureus]